MRRNRMLNLKYGVLLRLAAWKLRLRGRLRLDGIAFIGPGCRLEVGRGAVLELGRWSWLGHGCKIRCHEGRVALGAKSVMGQECTISAYQSVEIGRECVIADRVMLIDFDHGTVEVERPIRLQGIYKRDVARGPQRVDRLRRVHPARGDRGRQRDRRDQLGRDQGRPEPTRWWAACRRACSACGRPAYDALPVSKGGLARLALAVVALTVTGCTLNRPADPVVLNGAQLPALASVAAGDVVAFRWVNGSWDQVPIQVDERKAVNFQTVYNIAVSANFVTTVYADPGTFTGADANANVDADDEVVFMAKDVGIEAPADAADPGRRGRRQRRQGQGAQRRSAAPPATAGSTCSSAAAASARAPARAT